MPAGSSTAPARCRRLRPSRARSSHCSAAWFFVQPHVMRGSEITGPSICATEPPGFAATLGPQLRGQVASVTRPSQASHRPRPRMVARPANPGDARAHQRCIAAAAEVTVIFGGKWRDCGNAKCSNAPVRCRVLQARFR